jgi:hypothetical protein
MLSGGFAQAQSSIANIYPNGTNMFQPSSTLSFTASSPAGVTNVTVSLTVISLYKGTSFIKNLTASSGLTITGPSTALNVSAVLTSNTLYSAAIQVKDANGSMANQTVAFDTITPAYTWEAEDWNFTSNSITGQYIDNPQTNAYAGLASTDNVDSHNNNGGGAYRTVGTSVSPGGLSTEGLGSPETSYQRLQYIGTGKTDYDVGFTDGNDFGNYTRLFPVGTYNLFVRAAGGSGAKTRAADIVLGGGFVTISGSSPYKFGVKGRGWQSYDFMPVTDNSGNLIQITFDGNPATLQVLQNQAGDNMNFFMLMPINTNEVSTTVTITNAYPDGAFQFQATNLLSFDAFSSVTINPATDVSVVLASTNLFGVGSITNLTTANGLSVTGSATNIHVTASLISNMLYTAFIQVNDGNGIAALLTVKFDTLNPAYTFEGEDFNYGSGNFFDNPQTNAYNSLDGVAEVDYHRNNSGGNGGYNRVGLPGEGASDTPRITHVGFPDYDLGNTVGGNWGDYTRTYPAGIYNIFVRTARGDGGNVTDAGKISLVTSDRTQPNQTVQDLGKHSTPSTGGWQSYVWAPVINNGGFPARFVADGTIKTLRYTFDGAGENVGFIMLMPADLSVNPPPFVSSFTPDGTGLFQPSNTVTFVVNSSVGIAQTNVVLNLNGVNVSGLSFSGSSTLWNVSYPVKMNGFYTAIITLTDSAGTTKSTNVFNTFNANNYQWEAEDYDYNNGRFFDNPQVDSYLGLAGVSGSDYFESDLNGPGRSSGSPYRPADGFNIPDTTAGDQARSQFTAVSGTDYSIGSFGINSWANYTRNYPAGTYYVMGRFAEGAGPAGANLSLLIPGASTNLLGVFNVLNLGWGTWQWAQLVDNSANPVRITLDGTTNILRLGGTTGNEVNVNFLMLVGTPPTPKLTATVSGGNIHISFPTQTGYSYQLQYKNNLTDANWISLGSPLSGNGSIQTIDDSAAGNTRFYRVEIQ